MEPTTLAQSIQNAIVAATGTVNTFGLVIGAALTILVLYYIVAWWLGFVGRRVLGGRGTTQEVRAAIAWSQVPNIAVLGLVLIQLPFLQVQWLAGLMTAAILIVGIWGLVIGLKCLGEAHRFSAWRAFGTTLLALLPVMLLGVLAGIAVPSFLAGMAAATR